MSRAIIPGELFLAPGHIYLPAEAVQLCSVVASGVAVSIFDARMKRGGMGHYVRPYREDDMSTALFAAPAIVALATMFLETGSSKDDLEATLYGGAVNNECSSYVEGQSEENVNVGLELLAKLGINVVGRDTGGRKARKIIFDTGTGETVVARVERVREQDWYPDLGLLA